MGYAYIDTGAMYRAVTLYFHEHYISLTNPKEVENALEAIHITFQHNSRTNGSDTYLNGLNVEDKIRQMYISQKVSEVSTLAAVREAMVAQQQKMGKKKGIVMDGRDIGTKVFPDAELKIFMTADMQVRAERRQAELAEKGHMISYDEVLENLTHRDHLDTTRKESPLVKAEDAFLIDTSYITFEEQVDIVLNLIVERITQSV